MKIRVTVRSGSTPLQDKEFEGFVHAAFWVGAEHAEDEVKSVSVSLDPQAQGNVPEVQEFISLLVKREIDFSIEFARGPRPEPPPALPPKRGNRKRPPAPSRELERDAGYRAELGELKKALEEGRLTKEQYDENREVLFSSWRRRVVQELSQ